MDSVNDVEPAMDAAPGYAFQFAGLRDRAYVVVVAISGDIVLCSRLVLAFLRRRAGAAMGCLVDGLHIWASASGVEIWADSAFDAVRGSDFLGQDRARLLAGRGNGGSLVADQTACTLSGSC